MVGASLSDAMAKKTTSKMTKEEMEEELREEVKEEVKKEFALEKKKIEEDIEADLRREIDHEIQLKKAEVKFTLEEAVLTFVGGLAIGLGPWIGYTYLNLDPSDFAFAVVNVLAAWFGLLVFIVPIIRKIEQITERLG